MITEIIIFHLLFEHGLNVYNIDHEKSPMSVRDDLSEKEEDN